MDDLISVIVPVFNVEQYINKCIASLENQSYINFEVILIDDKSTDESLNICRTIQKKSQLNIKILEHKQNMGLESTRNDGLKAAKGKWICFLDSDDILEPYALECMLNFASKGSCDIVFSPYTSVFPDHTEIRNGNIRTGYYGKNEFLRHCLSNIPFDVMSCVGSKLYSKELIDSIRLKFDSEYKYNEDAGFMLNALKAANIIGYLNYPYYNYIRRSSNSIQTSYRPEMFVSISKARDILRDLFIESNCDSKTCLAAFYKLQFSLILESLNNEAKFSNFPNFKTEIKYIVESNDYHHIKDGNYIRGLKNKIFFLFFKLHFYHLLYLFFKLRR